MNPAMLLPPADQHAAPWQPAPNDPAARRRRARGAARLKALGIDVDTLDHEAVHELWEQSRAAYITIATAGLHMNPIHAEGDPLTGACAHARYGMLADAIRDYHGAHPEGWSAPRIDWPVHGEDVEP